jgi:hypothetical protein
MRLGQSNDPQRRTREQKYIKEQINGHIRSSTLKGMPRFTCRLIMIHIIEVSSPVGTRSKARVCGRSLAVIAGSNPTGSICMYIVSVVCCQVEVSASGWSLVQLIPTECGVPECDREAWIIRKPRHTGGCWVMGKEMIEVSSTVAEFCLHSSYIAMFHIWVFVMIYGLSGLTIKFANSSR